MSSWKILHSLATIDNPIFRRAISRPPLWYRGATHLASRATGEMLLFGGVLCYACTMLGFFVRNLLLFMAGSLLLSLIFFSLTIAPIIVNERERATWDILRTTPLTLDQLILAKARAMLWWLRGPLRVISALLIITALVISAISFWANPLYSELGESRQPTAILCSAALLIPFLSAAIFMIDRLQQFVLLVVSMLAASASSSSARAALPGAALAVLILSLLDVSFAVLLHSLQPDWSTSLEVIAALGSTPTYAFAMPSISALLAVLLTLAVREIAVRILWAWTLRAAQ